MNTCSFMSLISKENLVLRNKFEIFVHVFAHILYNYVFDAGKCKIIISLVTKSKEC